MRHGAAIYRRGPKRDMNDQHGNSIELGDDFYIRGLEPARVRGFFNGDNGTKRVVMEVHDGRIVPVKPQDLTIDEWHSRSFKNRNRLEDA